MDYARFGARLAQVRKSRGWTIRDVEERSGVSHGYINKLELGKADSVTIKTLEKVADAYEMGVDILMYEGDAPLWLPELSAEERAQVVALLSALVSTDPYPKALAIGTLNAFSAGTTRK